ncbi:hypothetical protein [Thermosyntropha sp.]|uniref:WD40/YVTN/BNR-like repeat-containing protein n=1 Tax=Thermosyntropha sp. TaxID=2740820 RepID=UPI0025D61753|nr:hypothetical protein [Thermosyntropha sp.]MBO8158286.1 hypothetical protein [Thermosyntropha sp.]
MIKKGLFIMGLVFLLFVAGGCQPADHDVPSDETGQEDWKWRNIGLTDQSIDKIELASDGEEYVLSGGKIYYRKEDKWLVQSLDEEVSAFCLIEKDSHKTIVAGTARGSVYIKSGDEAEWRKADIMCLSEPIAKIIFVPRQNAVYVGQSSKNGGGLWRSYDEGKSWEKVTDLTVRGIAVNPDNPDIIYIVDRLTYLSTDRGKTWKKLDTPANYGVLIHPLYPDIAYIAYSNGVVTATHEGKITGYQRFYLPGGITRLEYNPAHVSEWALGIWDFPSGRGGLYYSMNGGVHWVEVGEKMTDTRILDLCFNQTGDRLYIGTAEKGLWVLNVRKLKEDVEM